MNTKHLLLGLAAAAAAGLTLHANIGTGYTGGTILGRPVIGTLPRDATQWNEFGILYAVRDYESAGVKPLKVEVIDLGPSWTPLDDDREPHSGYAEVNGVQYQLIRNMTTGKLMVTLPVNAFTGSGDSLLVTAFDRQGTQLGCFSFGFFY